MGDIEKMKKRFDRVLYNEVDKKTKEKVFILLKDLKFIHAMENPKKTGVDILVNDAETNSTKFNIECEVKKVWIGSKFPYDSVQIPGRKSKFANLDKPTLFIMFNEDYTEYLVIKSSDLLASPLAEVPNKYCYKGEMFYQVPLEKVSFNDVTKPIKEIMK